MRYFERKPQMREHFVSFMKKIFQNRYTAVAPPLKGEEEWWYHPIFGEYHPKKPGQIQVLFDYNAQCNGVSLNDVPLTGPFLLGMLIRFCKESVIITAVIQQMFSC